VDGESSVRVYAITLLNVIPFQDWHVDFAASCVYYTVITGSKVFYFIKPTPANLAAYARCESAKGILMNVADLPPVAMTGSSNEETQQKEWLGDLAEGPVEKVTLKQGDTM
jgi:F-box/leucine-rich repeat protein 10/11